ncbi:MAG TPA: hypothetical protein VD794_14950, partial [Flavisolibacter sp.]|nr:hypothetical protein [Flavisolibacter sp.]
LYYDKYWSLCEKPLATYYRVCTLNKVGTIHFVGPFQDYNMNHLLLMKGSYDSTGNKHGLFTYFYANGKTKKVGHFINDEMRGFWYYYQPEGNLYFINNNYNSQEAAPVFVVLEGELVLKDGNGSFTIHTGDFPDVYNGQRLLIKGSIANNIKSGTWKFYRGGYSKRLMALQSETTSYHDGAFNMLNSNFMGAVDREPPVPRALGTLTPPIPTTSSGNIPKKVAKEVYENGVFKKGTANGLKKLKAPYSGIYYLPYETYLADRFYPDPKVFGELTDTNNLKQFVNFLISGTPPFIHVQSTAYNNNLQVLSTLVTESITSNLRFFKNRDPKDLKTEVPVMLWDYDTPLKFHCRFYIQPNGTVTDISMDGNLPIEAKERFLYYLSRMKGLVPHAEKSYTDIYVYPVTNKKKGHSTEYYISYYDNSTSR